MVGVQVGEHDPAHRRRIELRRDLVLGLELEAREAEVRVPPGQIARLRRLRRLTRVEEADAVGMIDRERVDGQRLVAPASREIPQRPQAALARTRPVVRRRMSTSTTNSSTTCYLGLLAVEVPGHADRHCERAPVT